MSALAGVRRLLLAALRRERVRLPVSAVVIGVLAAAVIASVAGLYESAQERAVAAGFNATNVIARAFNGPASGAELGALAFHETFIILSILVSILAVQTVVRHTRHEEDTGRAELVGAAAVGRRAPLVSALLVAAILSVASGVAYFGAFLVNGLGAAGAFHSGAALTATALVASGFGAIAAQVAASARAANGIAVAMVGLAFVLRAVGDASGQVRDDGLWIDSGWASWASPIGWGQQVRPYGADQLPVLLLAVGALVVTVAVALTLTSRRDLGAGLVAPRAGPARAGRFLMSTVGLAWRLQRGACVAWAVGLGVLAAAFGGLGDEAEAMLADNPQLADILGADAADQVVDRFLAFTVSLLAVAASGAIVQLVLRIRAEEMAGRLDPLLATATSRLRWVGGHVAVATVGTLGVMLALGLGGALAFTATTGQAGRGFSAFLLGALAHVPAVLAVGAVALVAVAIVPRAASALGWAMVAAAFLVQLFGEALDLPGWLVAVSPFSHVPEIGIEDVSWAPFTTLAVAVTTTIVAALAFRRRDLVSVA